jgi:hypothetical protein
MVAIPGITWYVDSGAVNVDGCIGVGGMGWKGVGDGVDWGEATDKSILLLAGLSAGEKNKLDIVQPARIKTINEREKMATFFMALPKYRRGT